MMWAIEVVDGIKVFETMDLVITSLFLCVVLVYVVSTVLVLVLPSLYESPRYLKVTLFIFCIFGAFALIIKYVTEYSMYVALGFLIFYVIAYAAFFVMNYKKHKREQKKADALLEKRLEMMRRENKINQKSDN